ncbi:MAG: ribosomal-processing cysteine protease Prp [Bacilli bacterium]|nr:ribosomal-processing cysteine protease Prp [Bacilli bacterium]
MINIIVKYKKNFVKEIIVSGHSDYAEYGKDIVCAGVSAISVGSLNAIYEFTGTKPEHIINDGYLLIKFSEDSINQIIAKVTLIQLESIEESYSKHIKITEER